MKKYQIPILSVIIFMFCQTMVLAQATTVGTMTLNKGVVKLRRSHVDTLYRTAGEKIPVRNLDEIQTGKDSSVTIKMEAKSDELELYSQSFFKIDSVTAQSSQLSMSIGKARFKIQKPRKPLKLRKNRKKRFRVRTANAIVGVKGTEFVLAAGTDVTSVLTIEGIVDVASVATPEIEVEVKENQASQIKQASTPTAPVTVPASVRDNIINTDAPNVFNSVQFGEAVADTSVKPETKKKSSSTEKKEEAKSGSQGKPPASKGGTTGLASPGTGSPGLQESSVIGAGEEEKTDNQAPEPDQGAVFGSETGSADVFEAEDAGADGIGDDDTINLENLDSAEIEDIDVEEPEIDAADIFDADTIIEEIEESTDELEDEIEDIQEVLNNQLQEIEIRILHN